MTTPMQVVASQSHHATRTLEDEDARGQASTAGYLPSQYSDA
jgi:hypothetical protein